MLFGVTGRETPCRQNSLPAQPISHTRKFSVSHGSSPYPQSFQAKLSVSKYGVSGTETRALPGQTLTFAFDYRRTQRKNVAPPYPKVVETQIDVMR